MGGQERAVVRHAQGLHRRGNDVSVLVQPDSPIHHLASRSGLVVHTIRMRRFSLFTFNAFRKVLKSGRPDILHVNSSRDSWLGALAARLIFPRIKVVKTRHISAPLNTNLPTQVLYRRLFDHVIVTGGPSNKQALVERDGLESSRVSAFPIGVELNNFSPGPLQADLRVELGVPAGHRLIGLVSYLRSYKGHAYFIEAAARLVSTLKDVTFLIVGEGPEEATIRADITRRGLATQVRMLGYREDLLNVFRSLDLFVMPSLEGDTIPQVLIEAMAAGVPVIATAVGSIPDVVKDGITGVLIPPRDAHLLAQGIEKLLNDRSLRQLVLTNARNQVIGSYSLEAMLGRLESTYTRVLAQ